MSETEELTFESGYTRLQTIAGRLSEEEVPVSEMCDLFAEGKGLEQALSQYLSEQRERVEAIERGEGIRAFKITSRPGNDEGDDDDLQSVPAAIAPSSPPDDIPF